jgi:hypothetical protein
VRRDDEDPAVGCGWKFDIDRRFGGNSDRRRDLISGQRRRDVDRHTDGDGLEALDDLFLAVFDDPDSTPVRNVGRVGCCEERAPDTRCRKHTAAANPAAHVIIDARARTGIRLMSCTLVAALARPV